jgi:hypothetical protein
MYVLYVLGCAYLDICVTEFFSIEMPSSILGKIANGMYNFAKNTYKGYKNPATVTSILGHINSKN